MTENLPVKPSHLPIDGRGIRVIRRSQLNNKIHVLKKIH